MDEETAKKRRSQALGNFTRNVNTFNNLIANESTLDVIKHQYGKVLDVWSALEKAQDTYLGVANIDINDNGGMDFLDEPVVRYTTLCW